MKWIKLKKRKMEQFDNEQKEQEMVIQEEPSQSESAPESQKEEVKLETEATVCEKDNEDLFRRMGDLISQQTAFLSGKMERWVEVEKGMAQVIERQECIIQQQHNAALKFQEDVLYKLQKNLIMELIDISDNIRMILHDYEQQPDYDLLSAVKSLNEWVDATLKNNSIRRYQDTLVNNNVLDRKRQNLVDKQTVADESLNNTYITERPGYEWSIPYLVVNSDVQLQKILDENKTAKMFSFVIRPEEVIKLEYRKEEIIE